MRGSRRPAKDRAKAVGIAMVAGVPEASRQTGIPMRTLRRYKDDPELAQLGLSAREVVAESLWVGIQVGIDEVYRGLTDPDERLRDKADALFGLMQQHALLTGGATMRSESRDLTKEFDDHELDLLRSAIEREDSASTSQEAAVVGGGPEGSAPADG